MRGERPTGGGLVGGAGSLSVARLLRSWPSMVCSPRIFCFSSAPCSFTKSYEHGGRRHGMWQRHVRGAARRGAV
eukprot:2583461-Prymnesium_polylepis.1